MTEPTGKAHHPPRQIIGVADVGSNSIKVRIVEGTRHNHKVLADVRYPVRLGRGTFSHGRILEEDIQRGLIAFRDFASRCHAVGTTRIVAVGTSALREANNAEEFARRVEQESGVRIQVIPGEEEARLIAASAIAVQDAGRSHLVIDIGGGSTEVICTRADGTLQGAVSLALGAVRLAEELEMPAAYTGDDVAALQRRVKDTLRAGNLPVADAAPVVIGTGGTARALADLQAVNPGDELAITQKYLQELLPDMTGRSVMQLAEHFNLDEKRAQIIVPGIVILGELLDHYGIPRIAVRDCGIRDGLINENLQDPLQVVAGVVHCDGKLLIARRAPGKHLAGYWEFPGGKIEPGETAEQCLARELMEEFHLAVTVDGFIASQSHYYGDRVIMLHAYHATAISPCGPGDSHDAVAWITPAELENYTMAPADEFICRALAPR